MVGEDGLALRHDTRIAVSSAIPRIVQESYTAKVRDLESSGFLIFLLNNSQKYAFSEPVIQRQYTCYRPCRRCASAQRIAGLASDGSASLEGLKPQ